MITGTVTNKEYALFLKETGQTVPAFSEKEADYPVVNVSYRDAVVYSKWLSAKDGGAVYRLPTEEEWELAAGHMPKDAEMNCGKNKGLTPVNAYKQTLSASGAVDMWGNVWEWTSTPKTASNEFAVKGGAWNTSGTSCRTENRGEERNPAFGYETVGFRLIREK